jgi:2-dehydro-3-deoxyphosphooctonate aldolase (KDO 8-P synthase)
MLRLKIIAGPCVIESAKHVSLMAYELKSITDKFDVDFYFKASFDKANRTRLDSFRGPGFRDGIGVLDRIRQDLMIKVTTDFHTEDQIRNGAQFIDVIQIPAFLCRQTDLLVAAGEMGKTVNIKKGQFASPDDMLHANVKVGHGDVWFTERGTQYGDSVGVDMDNIPALGRMRKPVILDCTHPSNGENQLKLAKEGLRWGADGIFMEVHDNPEKAKCDGKKSIRLSDFEGILTELCGNAH